MGQREEQEQNSWERFFNTGKVEDYLRYTSSKQDAVLGEAYSTKSGVFHEKTEGVKDKPYAGFYSSDRDHSQADSYR